MQGTLRVIPGTRSKRAHRLVAMRLAPSPLMIADLVGGELQTVEGFDTILHEGEAVSCKVFCGREPRKEPNPFANRSGSKPSFARKASRESIPRQLPRSPEP